MSHLVLFERYIRLQEGRKNRKNTVLRISTNSRSFGSEKRKNLMVSLLAFSLVLAVL